jgi:pyruvate/2-oxoglutarate dehydrogenase complex dihydrolipoamide acyltransferase (E2) component
VPADRPETDVSARPWTPESRDALLGRVTAITTGTAVAGCVGALGLAVGLAATASASPATKAAGSTKAATGSAAAPAAPQAPASTDAVAPADVKVEVLNGVGIAGAARLVAQQLRDAGFDVVATGNTTRTVRASGIIYGPGQSGAFQTLSKATGVTLSSSQGTSATLILVIGPDWQGALPKAQSNQSQGNGFSQPQSAPQGRSNNGGGNATSGGS